jgi:hypothetical protein
MQTIQADFTVGGADVPVEIDFTVSAGDAGFSYAYGSERGFESVPDVDVIVEDIRPMGGGELPPMDVLLPLAEKAAWAAIARE